MRVAILGILVCAAIVGGCGVKGPLYLPNQPKQATAPNQKDKPPPASPGAPPATEPAPKSM
ncbi:MAG: lipoprotein [Burkholderiaceae bacterium]|nr:lipoprotein [Burkholderiaceae bacterium]